MSDVANVSANAAAEEGGFTEDVFDLMAKIENDGAVMESEPAEAETEVTEESTSEGNAAESGEAADSSESVVSDTAEAGSNVIPFCTTESTPAEEKTEEKTEEKEKAEEKIELILPKDEDFIDPGTGDNLKDATAKLQKELDKYKAVPEGMPAMVLTWLLKQLPGDPVLCERVMWKHKTYDECASFMYQKAAEICMQQMKEMSIAKMRDACQTIKIEGSNTPAVGFSMANDVSYCHAIEYFRLDDLAQVKEEAIKKAKAEYESKKTQAKIKAAAKNSPKSASKSKSSAPAKSEKKAEKKEEKKEEKKQTEDLMSLFDL